jgi:hypothetical protein
VGTTVFQGVVLMTAYVENENMEYRVLFEKYDGELLTTKRRDYVKRPTRS